MCPDPQMLSLYYDEELPSPWKEKLETHLEGCSPCRERLEQFRRLSGSLERGSSIQAPAERVWRRLNNAEILEWKAPARIWSRSVSVPLPLLIAVAALILALGVFFVRTPRAAAPDDSALAALDMRTIVPVSDLDGVLQYLGDDNSPDIMIIRLPESRSFMSSGEPAIIRAAEYGAGKRSP
ncbi:MAG: zf-HC2 domain-containing protein [Treponema sp.]|nr:zf-HC2 domain-containing protein [Treponema sp.]